MSKLEIPNPIAKRAVINKRLVQQYAHLFGPASVEVCKDAVKGIIGDAPKDQIPQLLL